MTSEKGLWIDIGDLRAQLHAAVDEVLARFLDSVSVPSEAASEESPTVVAGDVFGRWTFRWPDKQEEEFSSGRCYTLRGGSQTISLRLAWTTRRAWGRERERAIVFQQMGGADSYYPLVEFVETDDPGRFASPIPDPGRPRALLTDTASLPPRLRGATVARADQLFRSIDNGPSLRLVVRHDDEADMVRHGYWVGRLRGRISA